jgi:hypothetical protein
MRRISGSNVTALCRHPTAHLHSWSDNFCGGVEGIIEHLISLLSLIQNLKAAKQTTQILRNRFFYSSPDFKLANLKIDLSQLLQIIMRPFPAS